MTFRTPRARRPEVLRWLGVGVAAIAVGGLLAGASGAGQSAADRRAPGARFVGARSLAQVDAERALRRIDRTAVADLLVELPALAAPTTEATPAKGRLKVGEHRDLAGARSAPVTGGELHWEAAVGGGFVSTVAVVSPGAGAVRVALRVARLPAGAELRFYAPGDPETSFGPFGAEVLVATPAERSGEPGEELFWSPVIDGEALAIEVWLRSTDDAAALELSLPTLSHLARNPIDARHLNQLGNSQGCEKDIACAKKWLDVADSVAKIIFESGGGSFLCTGTLVNDTDNSDQRLLFITAAHCINKNSEAKSTTFYWFFQRAKCKGADPTSVEQTSGGARLRYTSKFQNGVETTDTTLMELKKDPPDGAALSGWSAADPDDLSGRNIWGIHHPSGDVKMGSKGGITDQVQVVPSSGGGFFIFDGDPLTHHEVVWKRGVTESGSSGSGIWYGKKWPDQYLVGWLSGGLSFCSAPKDPDYYGRFDEAYEVKKFRKFLDPENARLEE